MNTNHHLEELNRRLDVVRSRVSSVARRYANGFYLFGRAGTSKTYTVRMTLDGLNKPYHYHSGHLTPMGLFELVEQQHDRTIVLDDVSELLGQEDRPPDSSGCPRQPAHGYGRADRQVPEDGPRSDRPVRRRNYFDFQFGNPFRTSPGCSAEQASLPQVRPQR